MSLLLSRSEQGVVIFHIWKNLQYGTRFSLSLVLILAGFYIQYSTFNIFPGILLVFAGNLLLLVKGYDNRIKLGTFSANAEWINTDTEHLTHLAELQKKLRRWDTSALDITSGLGVFIFILAIGTLIAIIAINPFHMMLTGIMVVVNIAILIFPHWFTGVKRITTLPALVNKIKIYLSISEEFGSRLKNENISYLMLLKGKDQKLPSDVKMKIKFHNQPESFLGLYAQISMNNVQGQDYPYFYVVLVAKRESGLIAEIAKELNTPENVISELSSQEDSEVLVIRQYTTKKSGYHTNTKAINTIFDCGLETCKKHFN